MGKIRVGIILILVTILLASCTEIEEKVYTDHESFIETIKFEFVEVKDGTNYTNAIIYTDEETFVWKVESYGISKTKHLDIIRMDDESNTNLVKISYKKDQKGNQTEQKLYIGQDKLKELSAIYAEDIGSTMRVMDEDVNSETSEE